MNLRGWLLTPVLLAMLLVSACSDSNTAESERGGVSATISAGLPESLDHAGYVAIANTMCTESSGRDELGEPVGSDSSAEQIDEQHDVVARRLAQLRALPVPEGDQSALEQIEQAYDRVLIALDELSNAVDSDDTQAAVVIATALDSLRSAANQLVSSFGAGSCIV